MRIRCSLFLPGCHSRIVRSVPPLARVAPSGLSAIACSTPLWPCKICNCFRLATDHNRMVELIPLVYMVCPSRLKITPVTQSVWSIRTVPGWKTLFSSTELVCHNLTVPSKLPLTNRLPSGLNATDHTQPVCPSRVATSSPVATLHNRIEPSKLPLASRRPSGLKATDCTVSEWPDRTINFPPLLLSQSRTVRS